MARKEKSNEQGEIAEAQAEDDEEVVEKASVRIDQLFAERIASRRRKRFFKTQNAAIRSLPEVNLGLISVPGAFAAIEALEGLKNGLNVFLFSDNVSFEEEIFLKKMAQERGLLMMGPDCGTAIINGIGLGFANRVRRGQIGIVGASGTGIQEVSMIIHNLGMGISHGIDPLLKDSSTRLIVLVSKPPNSRVKEVILKRVAQGEKPFVINFLGMRSAGVALKNCYFVDTLEEAAELAVSIIMGKKKEKRESIESNSRVAEFYQSRASFDKTILGSLVNLNIEYA